MDTFSQKNSTGEGNEVSQKKDWLLPTSILIAALLIAGSLIYSAGKRGPEDTNIVSRDREETASVKNMRPVSDSDYIRGNPDAPIKIVEYSDLECPFCKSFHDTLKKTIEVYGGKVAWVYRHAPLDDRHPKARKEAEAVECAGEIGGKDKFWSYMDVLMEISPLNNGLDPKKLPEIATMVGLDATEFNQCLSSGKYAEKIQADLDNAINSGLQGTPFPIIVVNGEIKGSLPGALPFNEVLPEGQVNLKTIIDQEISNL